MERDKTNIMKLSEGKRGIEKITYTQKKDQYMYFDREYKQMVGTKFLRS